MMLMVAKLAIHVLVIPWSVGSGNVRQLAGIENLRDNLLDQGVTHRIPVLGPKNISQLER